MDMMMRRRAMMVAQEDTGPEYTLSQTIKIQNGRSSTIQLRWISWLATTVPLGSTYRSSALAAGTTLDFTTLATDGKHIWLFASNCTTVKYNGATASFKRSGNNFQVEIPQNYDSTIPLVFS